MVICPPPMYPLLGTGVKVVYQPGLYLTRYHNKISFGFKVNSNITNSLREYYQYMSSELMVFSFILGGSILSGHNIQSDSNSIHITGGNFNQSSVCNSDSIVHKTQEFKLPVRYIL